MTMDPTRRRHLLITVILLLTGGVIIGILGKGLMIDQKKVPSALIGKAALPFEAGWIQGQEIIPQAKGDSFKLSDIKGRPIVLNFWASWCHSCRDEARDFEAFWKKHKGTDVLVVGIAIQDTVEEALKFARYYGKTYTLGLDRDGKASIDYGVSGVPETFFIDRSGTIVHKEVGPVSTELLDKMVTLISK